MSEQIHDHVSAFIDDELSAEECAFLVRRFERDPEAREKLVRYSLIGSALREELPHPEPDILRRRVQAAVNGTSPAIEPAIAAPPPVRSAAHSRWTNPAIGLGVAASVAVAALITIRALNGVEAESAQSGVATASVPTYVVPADSQDPRVVVPAQVPIRLTNYLLHHGEYARLSRTSVHSSVVGASDLPFVTEVAGVGDTRSVEHEVQ